MTREPALTNWAGNVAFTPERFHRPSSIDELRRIVAAAPAVRALGTGHSFNEIASTPGDLVCVTGLPRVVEVDVDHARVRVSAGLRYGDLTPALDDCGLALANLASLPHISVGGACATGTHGSGDGNPVLAQAVSALELVTASGDLLTLTRDGDGDRFDGAVVGLGALGVVTTLTLDLQPRFDVRQVVYEGMPLDAVRDHLDEIMARGYSVSLFTTWRSDVVEQVWVKQRLDPAGGAEPLPQEWLGAVAAVDERHPLPGVDGDVCTPQLGVTGPWHTRLPHFRLQDTPSTGDELQTEYLLPREHALAALEAVHDLRDRVAPLLQVCEVRSVAADRLWLSPASGRDSLGVHFTWLKDPDGVAGVLPALEERLGPLGARPHWGKVFGMDAAAVRGSYPRWDDFARLVGELDPAGTFRNPFLTPFLGPAPGRRRTGGAAGRGGAAEGDGAGA